MPVRIIDTQDNSLDPAVISLDEYAEGRANFSLHYFHTAEAIPFEGSDYNIMWDVLQLAVNDFMTANNVPESEVCLRFVHCFEVANNTLYMRLQICRMQETQIIEFNKQAYALDTSVEAWYTIKQGEFSPTPVHLLNGPEYFNNFYYKAEEGSDTMECLADETSDMYVKNIVFPWEAEIKKMYEQNGAPPAVNINFGSCSYTNIPDVPGTVLWPHGLVMYLSDQSGHRYLDNNHYISIFHNKGADNGTLCPTHCNVYLMPLQPIAKP